MRFYSKRDFEIPKQIKPSINFFIGAALIIGSLLVISFIDSELERRDNLVTAESYEVK